MIRSELSKKEQQAIRLLRSVGDQPIEVCYSGGKDSDVILALAQMAGINYRAIYKNTTIDPPGTIAHCRSKGVEIVQPTRSFLKIIEQEGFPTRIARKCCKYLKEYKIMDKTIIGVRRSESTARAKRYKEPVICRVYNAREKTEQYMPILEWTDKDVADFISANGIQCHPLYYDKEGRFHVERRLGCMGCPLKSDRGLADFKQYPRLFRAICKAGKVWWERPREKELSSKKKFGDLYGLLYNNLFCNSYRDFLEKNGELFGKRNFKAEFEDFFGIDLP